MSRSFSDREYHVRDRGLTPMVFDICKEEFEFLYNERQIDRDMFEYAIKFARQSIGGIVDEIANHYNSDYLTESDVEKWIQKNSTLVIDEVDRILDEQDRSHRRDGRRDDRSRDRNRGRDRDRDRDRGRGTRVGFGRRKDTDDSTPSVGYGARKPSDIRQKESDEDRQSRLASQGSQRLKNDQQAGATKPVAAAVKEPQAIVPGSFFQSEDFDYIGPETATEAVIEITPCEVSQSINNSLYTVNENLTAVLDKTIVVNSKKLTLTTPMCSTENAFAFLKHDDPMLINPEHFCHYVIFPKLSVHKVPTGAGVEVLTFMGIAEEVLMDEQIPIAEKLIKLAMKLNNAPQFIRTLFQARILKKWNTVARCNFALPEQPNQYLEIASFDQMQQLFMEVVDTKDTLTDKIKAITQAKGTNSYLGDVNACMSWVLKSSIQGQNGFAKLNESTASYLSGFDQIPIVIDRTKRPRDVDRMTPDEKQMLITQFQQDWVCSIEKTTALVTNIKLDALLSNPRINCVTARDRKDAQLLRGLMKRSKYYVVYSTVPKSDQLQYRSHAGILHNGDVQLVKLREDY